MKPILHNALRLAHVSSPCSCAFYSEKKLALVVRESLGLRPPRVRKAGDLSGAFPAHRCEAGLRREFAAVRRARNLSSAPILSTCSKKALTFQVCLTRNTIVTKKKSGQPRVSQQCCACAPRRFNVQQRSWKLSLDLVVDCRSRVVPLTAEVELPLKTLMFVIKLCKYGAILP